MSYTFQQIDYTNKNKFYQTLIEELQYHLDQYWFTNLSQVSALLFDHLPRINWVGFYLYKDQELILGPYQGKPACMRIKVGRGVCGTSAEQKKTIIVANVDEFPGHIACDSASRSEIVVPLFLNDRLIGILDVDSPELDRFDQSDADGLRLLTDVVLNKTDFTGI
ncbi:MAG: GAF domain-containing protein [Pseudobdellovibrio sp.]